MNFKIILVSFLLLLSGPVLANKAQPSKCQQVFKNINSVAVAQVTGYSGLLVGTGLFMGATFAPDPIPLYGGSISALFISIGSFVYSMAKTYELNKNSFTRQIEDNKQRMDDLTVRVEKLEEAKELD